MKDYDVDDYSSPMWLSLLPEATRQAVLRFINTGEADEAFLRYLDDNVELRELIDKESERRVNELGKAMQILKGIINEEDQDNSK
ncbi:MAG: hypothetical protein ACXADW_22030 [Candidatus Hodarchaeales archaeon]